MLVLSSSTCELIPRLTKWCKTNKQLYNSCNMRHTMEREPPILPKCRQNPINHFTNKFLNQSVSSSAVCSSH